MHSKRKKYSVPDCDKCSKKRVALIEENYTAFSIIEEWSDLFSDGMGNINVSLIKDIVDMYNLDTEEKLITLKLILIGLKTVKEKSRSKNG